MHAGKNYLLKDLFKNNSNKTKKPTTLSMLIKKKIAILNYGN